MPTGTTVEAVTVTPHPTSVATSLPTVAGQAASLACVRGNKLENQGTVYAVAAHVIGAVATVASAAIWAALPPSATSSSSKPLWTASLQIPTKLFPRSPNVNRRGRIRGDIRGGDCGDIAGLSRWSQRFYHRACSLASLPPNRASEAVKTTTTISALRVSARRATRLLTCPTDSMTNRKCQQRPEHRRQSRGTATAADAATAATGAKVP